ncbi:hypothetical protein PI859_25920 [Burkholderia pseudomallei]|uniref:hypothetical protein n=1 Tax=Burkholderia pseudomallei TaxID=28450 RepID=UPI000A79CC93|nr:hypothetical protein [Burkholderia pseudomallei]MDA5593515.1 hypothetical protein [Burkholderia pseudomallei]
MSENSRRGNRCGQWLPWRCSARIHVGRFSTLPEIIATVCYSAGARACQRAVIELKQPAAAGASRSIRAHAERGASRACEHARRRRRAGRGARARAHGARGALTEALPLQNIRGQVVPAARDATERFETRA